MPTKDLPLVIVVDDDKEIRNSVTALLSSVDIEAIAYESPAALLSAELPDRPGCLILDVRMPGGSGLDLQRRLAGERGVAKPVIFMTGHGDIPMSVQAMKAGAIDFLIKPVREQCLLDAVTMGIERDRSQRGAAQLCDEYLQRFARLTAREREVIRHVAMGLLNKQTAHLLGISEVTVKLHRGNVMNKMGLNSVGELVRVWEIIVPHLDAGEDQDAA
ncbi:MAG: response regulator transcription factor [Sphingopyxis sp.]|nr:response regulator transcription factor [Sphingopyxis sp.]